MCSTDPLWWYWADMCEWRPRNIEAGYWRDGQWVGLDFYDAFNEALTDALLPDVSYD